MKIVQIGLNTSDIAASLRFYAEAFGFRNGGGQALWGNTIQVQGLAAEDSAMMWWMVGAQDFFQLEFFHHTSPAQRPMRADWRPSDLGWVRFGILVDDLAPVLEALDKRSIKLLGSADREPGLSIAFRDPLVGVVVQATERRGTTGPVVEYITSSVSDIDSARRYYAETIGLPIAPLETLHQPEAEAIWGLTGAQREGFVVTIDHRSLEIVQYLDPVGRPRPQDYLISDQGIMNVALASRSVVEVEALFARLADAGYRPPAMMRSEGIVAGYIVDAGRELEIAAIPREMDRLVGFEYTQPFFT